MWRLIIGLRKEDMKKLKKFKPFYDADTDTLYKFISSGREEYYEEIIPGVNIEYDNNKKLIGIEYLNYSNNIMLNSMIITEKRKEKIMTSSFESGYKSVYSSFNLNTETNNSKNILFE